MLFRASKIALLTKILRNAWSGTKTVREVR